MSEERAVPDSKGVPEQEQFLHHSNGPVDFYEQRKNIAWSKLSAGLKYSNLELAKVGARKMAGLGSGLTPAGDDFLLGVIYSLWSIWDAKIAQIWATELSLSAIPRTTKLSAAWLIAGAKGEAVKAWHDLVNAIVEKNPEVMINAASKIMVTGSSSGFDALSGYAAGLNILTGENLHDSSNRRGW